MNPMPLYPLRFEPIFQYRPWGGRRLADLLSTSLPGDGPIGEAWLLSDREGCSSLVANGPLEGHTIRQLMNQWPEPLLGKQAGHFQRFPLLLKFLDARTTLCKQPFCPRASPAKRKPGWSWRPGQKGSSMRA